MRLYRFLFLVVVVLGSSVAHADNRVALMSDPSHLDMLHSALQVALAGRGVGVVDFLGPEGSLRLDRAAFAQRAALGAGADAGIWIEEQPGSAELCAVSSDGRYFRHAPLPIDDAWNPRVFAAVATSLLDEIMAPPEAGMPNVNVDVHVSVGPGGETTVSSSSPLHGITMAPPGMMLTAPGVIGATERPVRWNRTLVEVGPMLTPITAGVEGGLAFPLSPSTRLAVTAIANVNFIGSRRSLILGGGLELRHVGQGERHFDIGAMTGIATIASDLDDAVFYAGLRLSVTWESLAHGASVSVVPLLLLPFGPEGPVPAVFASLRWELPV